MKAAITIMNIGINQIHQAIKSLKLYQIRGLYILRKLKQRK